MLLMETVKDWLAPGTIALISCPGEAVSCKQSVQAGRTRGRERVSDTGSEAWREVVLMMEPVKDWLAPRTMAGAHQLSGGSHELQASKHYLPRKEQAGVWVRA